MSNLNVMIYRILNNRSWIGYHDPNWNNKYIWLNGKYLPDNDDNWDDGLNLDD